MMDIRQFIKEVSGLEVDALDLKPGSLVRILFDCGRLFERKQRELFEKRMREISGGESNE